MFIPIKSSISAKNIKFEHINQFEKDLKTCFSKIKLMSSIIYKLNQLY